MTVSNFMTMLNEKLTLPLQYNTFLFDTYIMRKTKDVRRDWLGGNYIVPFEAGQQDNYQSNGGLVPMADLQTESFVRGSITDYREVSGAITALAKDMHQHGGSAGRVPADTFYRQKLGKLLMKAKSRFQYKFSYGILTGQEWDSSSTAGTAKGVLTVTSPYRFVHGQKVIIQKQTSANKPFVSSSAILQTEGYVNKIDMGTKKVTFTTKSGGDLDLSSYTLASSAKVKIFNPGDEPSLADATDQTSALVRGGGFTSLREQVFTSTNGGSDTLFGQTKTDYQFLQSLNVSMSGASTREGFVFALYDAFEKFLLEGQPYSTGRTGERTNETGNMNWFGRGNSSIECLISVPWFGVLKKYFLTKRGDYFKSIRRGPTYFDAPTMMIEGPNGNNMHIVGIRDLPNSIGYIVGDDPFQFATNNFIRNYPSPDGNKWHTERTATGASTDKYQYVCDFTVYGDFILKRPAGVMGLHSFPTTLPTS